MDLFIETPTRRQARAELLQREAPRAGGPQQPAYHPQPYAVAATRTPAGQALDLDEAPGFEARSRDGAYGHAEHPGGRSPASATSRSGRPPLWDAARDVALAGRQAVPGAAGSGDGAFDRPRETEPSAPAKVSSAYARELDFDGKRARRRKLKAAARMLATIVLFPLLLAAVFLVSYALACIAGGATPQELVDLMGKLFSRIGAFIENTMTAG